MTTPEVTARECRFAVHIPAKPLRGTPDIHFVKEQLHYADGTIKPNVRLIKDYKRPFWITNRNKRNHEQKKEWEHLEYLTKGMCTQSELRDQIAIALEKRWSQEQLKQLCASPYVYGADVSSSSYIKLEYTQKYPNVMSPYTFGTLDVETDVVYGTESIIMTTVTFKTTDGLKVFTSVVASYAQGFSNLEERVEAKTREYLGEHLKRLNIEFEFEIADSPVGTIASCMKRMHEWKPDFLAIWNVDFDIQKIMADCEREGVDIADLFCDPIVPKPLRYFKYKQGKKKKITASGKVTPINPADQWHYVDCPSSFWIIDAMCVYRQIRLAKQAEVSYSLDAILTKEKIGIRKLKFEAADSYIGIRWHQFMQTNHKVEYIVYNRFDCISMVELELKIKDLMYTLPSFAGITDFSRFNSQPKKIADAMHTFLLNEQRVAATVGMTEKKIELPDAEADDDPDAAEIEPEDQILSLKDWIITLPAHLMTDDGLKCIAEDPEMRTNIRPYVSDSDAVSSYPSDISACNVSKETTMREIINIEGISENVFRLQNINVLSGHVNSIEYCRTMFNFPEMRDLLTLYKTSR